MTLIITGAHGAGLDETAELLEGRGWTVDRPSLEAGSQPDELPKIDFEADCIVSDLAAPFIEELVAEHGCEVVVLVRPPVDSIAAMLFDRPVVSPEVAAFIAYHCPTDDFLAGPERVAAYWLKWNRLAQHPKATVVPMGAGGPDSPLAEELGLQELEPGEGGLPAPGRAFDFNNLSLTTQMIVIDLADELGVPLSSPLAGG